MDFRNYLSKARFFNEDRQENRILLAICKEKLSKYLESAILWSEETFGKEGFIQLKEKFVANLGLSLRDESFFERYGEYFLNYYLFVADSSAGIDPAVMSVNNISPQHPNFFEAFLASSRYTKYLRSDPGIRVLHLLRSINFSLYKLEKVAKSSKYIIVKDVFLGKKSVIEPLHDQLFTGLIKGELIQGFVFPVGEISILLKGHVCHPFASKPFIEKQLSTYIGKREIPPLEVLQQLAKAFQHLSRHVKVPIGEVYKSLNI